MARKIATAIGSTTPAAAAGTSSFAAARSIAGRQASEDWVLIASAWVGAIARVKRTERDARAEQGERPGGEPDDDPDRRDDDDIMEQGAERRAAGARADDEGEREHADRPDPQHPVDDHQHHVDDRLEEADQPLARLLRQPGEGEGEDEGEQDQRQDRVLGSPRR